MLRKPVSRTAGLVLGYAACFWTVRLIVLTIITYTYMRSNDDKSVSTLQKIGDIVRANQVITYGFSAFVFVLLLQILHPLTRTNFKQIFDTTALRERFPANALNGLILTAVLLLGTALGGHMSYLGVYMKFDEVVLAITSSGVFAACLFLIAVVEEYILREALEPIILDRLGPIATALISSSVFLAFKFVQFELSWIDALNLILLNLTLSMIARNERSFMASASFFGAYLTLAHVLFGLPFMGQDMPGIFLLRAASDTGLGNLLSGGTTGPESGIVLTVLLVIYLYLPQIRSKKIEV